MINGKTKGKMGEREAADLLGKMLGKSNTIHDKVFVDTHAQSGDIISIAGLSIEIKRHETLAINTWWNQACRQADRDGTVPVLMFRQNRRDWRFMLPAYLLVVGLTGYIELSEVVFAQWLNHWVLSNVSQGD